MTALVCWCSGPDFVDGDHNSEGGTTVPFFNTVRVNFTPSTPTLSRSATVQNPPFKQPPFVIEKPLPSPKQMNDPRRRRPYSCILAPRFKPQQDHNAKIASAPPSPAWRATPVASIRVS